MLKMMIIAAVSVGLFCGAAQADPPRPEPHPKAKDKRVRPLQGYWLDLRWKVTIDGEPAGYVTAHCWYPPRGRPTCSVTVPIP
jgi:hypothetical protein